MTGTQCLEQALATLSEVYMLLFCCVSYLKGISCDGVWVQVPGRPQRRSMCKPCLRQMNSRVEEKLEAAEDTWT